MAVLRAILCLSPCISCTDRKFPLLGGLAVKWKGFRSIYPLEPNPTPNHRFPIQCLPEPRVIQLQTTGSPLNAYKSQGFKLRFGPIRLRRRAPEPNSPIQLKELLYFLQEPGAPGSKATKSAGKFRSRSWRRRRRRWPGPLSSSTTRSRTSSGASAFGFLDFDSVPRRIFHPSTGATIASRKGFLGVKC